MPNKGGKKKKSKKGTGEVLKRTLVFKDDMQEYAVITKMLGDRRLTVMLPDQTETLAIIPGRFRKRCWMRVGDIIVVSHRDFQDGKMDVCYKYNDDEVRQLARHFEIPQHFLDANSAHAGQDDGNDIQFGEFENEGEDEELEIDNI